MSRQTNHGIDLCPTLRYTSYFKFRLMLRVLEAVVARLC